MARLITTSLFLAFALAAPSQRDDQPQYDFVIVGGGTSGLVLANRLSEDPNTSVAVIEAGGTVFDNPNVTSTTAYGNVFNTDLDWAFDSTAQEHANNMTQVLRAGKALGGSSTINGMTYLRAESSQIDAWAKLGNNINWDILLPYYKKAEGLSEPNQTQMSLGASYDPEVHGLDGPITVGWPTELVGGDFPQILNTTCAAMGLSWNEDANSGYMRRYNVYPQTADPVADIRMDAARAYYLPIQNRSNLHVFLNSSVERLVWSNASNFANAVMYRDAWGMERSVQVKKEVVLSAGCLVSPLILERSGVGNPDILDKYGVQRKIELPGVGENLQDQIQSSSSRNSSTNFTGNSHFVAYLNARDIFGDDTDGMEKHARSSIHSRVEQVVEDSSNTINRTAIQQLFEIQLSTIFQENSTISEVLIMASSQGTGSMYYWGLTTFSRGSMHITSANASAAADINPNYFHLDYDISQQIGTAKAVRHIATTAPFSGLLASEIFPGLNTVPADATDEQWTEWLKDHYQANSHYTGTAAMMPEEMGGVVCDQHLVHGSENVRVVDASVVPFPFSGHPTATLYALAERAADVIKAKYANGTAH